MHLTAIWKLTLTLKAKSMFYVFFDVSTFIMTLIEVRKVHKITCAVHF